MDSFGVPEFFATHIGEVEYLEGGIVRIVRTVSRAGVMMPVYSLITPLECVLQASRQLREATERTLAKHRVEMWTAH